MTQKAYMGIPVPGNIAERIHSFKVSGEKEAKDNSHITLVYMGEVEEDTIAQALLVLLDFCPKYQPIPITSSVFTQFPAGDDGVPLICKVESPELVSFQKDLTAALDAAGVPFSKKFPDYKPHITVSYAEEPIQRDLDIDPPIEFLADRMFFRLGGRGNDQADIDIRIGPNQHQTVAKMLRAAAMVLRG
jgi:2'-5' RNA ligase